MEEAVAEEQLDRIQQKYRDLQSTPSLTEKLRIAREISVETKKLRSAGGDKNATKRR